MPTYDVGLDKLRFYQAVQDCSTISTWPRETLEAMFEELTSEIGLNVNQFADKHGIYYMKVERLFKKTILNGHDIVMVTNQSSPRIYKFKYAKYNEQMISVANDLEELKHLRAFRAGFDYQPENHNPLVQPVLSLPDMELVERLIRHSTFAVSVAQSLGVYVDEHKDDPLTKLIRDYSKEPAKLISQLLEWSRLWLLQEDRDS